jgi:hypothetical protein
MVIARIESGTSGKTAGAIDAEARLPAPCVPDGESCQHRGIRKHLAR